MAERIAELARLVEITSLPVIYSDGPARVVIEGPIVRVTYFEYRMIAGERVRMPVLEMIRPVSSCVPGLIQAMIQREAAVAEDIGRALQH